MNDPNSISTKRRYFCLQFDGISNLHMIEGSRLQDKNVVTFGLLPFRQNTVLQNLETFLVRSK